MVQGFLIARPSADVASLLLDYPAAATALSADRRGSTSAPKVDGECIVRAEPVQLRADLSAVLARFRKDPDASIIPVVNEDNEPVGVYREQDFRDYVYSPYGISVLEHIAAEFGAAAFLVRVPTAPLGTDLARIVEMYGSSADAGGVVLTEGGRYAGVLPAEELLSLVAESEVAEARDQNPLTRLPGNLRVAELCAQRLADPGPGAAFAYFDFDSFKPFNDLYGFRNGDRVIMLFSDILKSTIRCPPGFIGHLGGDDFFVCIDAEKNDDIAPLAEAADRFAREAASFYSAEDRERGWIFGTDRSGRRRHVPLLTVSVAIVILETGATLDAEGLSEILAELKKKAKASSDRRAIRVFSKEERSEPHPMGMSGAGPRSGGQGLARGGRATPIFTPSLIAAC
jgi:GGDEF domain-containing protein